MAKPPVRRFFFVPSRDGGWDVAEATKGVDGWEVRRPGRFGAESMAEVPPPGGDWMEALAPKRQPRPAKPSPGPAAERPAAKPPKQAARAPPKPEYVAIPGPRQRPASKGKPHAHEPKAMPRKAVASLSHELEDLLLKEQRGQAVPKGKVQCPVCGLIVEPMRAKKVRTHDNPITGARCIAAGKPWSDFGV
jgi:hypothetical protein